MLYNRITARSPIEKGWSGDKKYRITDESGNCYLLRISPMDRCEQKKHQFARMQQAAALDIPMCLPLEFGICDEGVYTIQSWISGLDAEDVIACLTRKEQYTYGLDSGRILKKLHTLPAPDDIAPWAARFNRKIDRKIAMYENSPLKYEEDAPILTYLAENRHLLEGRPQTYQHGDYHIGNMMVDDHGILTVIDFDRDDCGDPWEEFNRIVWCAQKVPYFAAGMVDGYFDGGVPTEFWELLALYICSNTLSSLPWAVSFGDKEIQIMRKQEQDILRWYDNMRTVIPSWYQKP